MSALKLKLLTSTGRSHQLRCLRSSKELRLRPSKAVEDGSGTATAAMLIALNVVESETKSLVSTNVNAITPEPSEMMLRSS